MSHVKMHVALRKRCSRSLSLATCSEAHALLHASTLAMNATKGIAHSWETTKLAGMISEHARVGHYRQATCQPTAAYSMWLLLHAAYASTLYGPPYDRPSDTVQLVIFFACAISVIFITLRACSL